MTTPSTWKKKFDEKFTLPEEGEWYAEQLKLFISSVVIPEVLKAIVPEEIDDNEALFADDPQKMLQEGYSIGYNACVAEIRRRILDTH